MSPTGGSAEVEGEVEAGETTEMDLILHGDATIVVDDDMNFWIDEFTFAMNVYSHYGGGDVMDNTWAPDAFDSTCSDKEPFTFYSTYDVGAQP